MFKIKFHIKIISEEPCIVVLNEELNEEFKFSYLYIIPNDKYKINIYNYDSSSSKESTFKNIFKNIDLNNYSGTLKFIGIDNSYKSYYKILEGKKHGKSFEFYNFISSCGYYFNDEIDGKFFTYDENGKLVKIENRVNYRVVYEIYFNLNYEEKIIYSKQIFSEKGVILIYEITFNKNGEIETFVKWFGDKWRSKGKLLHFDTNKKVSYYNLFSRNFELIIILTFTLCSIEIF
jgi:hypothetical protein